MTRADLAEVVQLIRAVARTEIMPRFRTLQPGEVQTKSGPLDLVTVADEQAEVRLSTGLQRLFPGCAVVGEEGAARDPGLLGAIRGADVCFIVDPIDGTANFCAGLPLFGIIIALARRGELAGCAIHDPVSDDTAVALRGEGAWMETATGHCSTLRVAAPVPVGEMTGSVSWRYMTSAQQAVVCPNLPRVAAAWDYRCAAHQYRMMAAGHCHFSVYQRLLPWDHAAGWLLHQEAGGWSARLDGSAYQAQHTGGGLVLAPDRESGLALLEALFSEREQVGKLRVSLARSR